MGGVPEGDTLVQAQNVLRPALVGRPVVEVVVRPYRYPAPRVGTRITEVEARGKYLLIHFEGGTTLHSHLLMTGAWHLYPTGGRWRDVPGAMRAKVVVADHEAVLFRTPVARLWPRGLGTERPWELIGPDLCRPPVDYDEILRRLDAVVQATPIGEVLLEQRVAAGIGNVYKSEVLWAQRLDPFRPLASLDADERLAVYETASRLLVSNLDRPRRVTYRRGLAVYGKRGRGCPVCHTRLSVAEQGPPELRRTTTWCPRCQPRG
jgi:endonuclease-8